MVDGCGSLGHQGLNASQRAVPFIPCLLTLLNSSQAIKPRHSTQIPLQPNRRGTSLRQLAGQWCDSTGDPDSGSNLWQSYVRRQRNITKKLSRFVTSISNVFIPCQNGSYRCEQLRCRARCLARYGPKVPRNAHRKHLGLCMATQELRA